MNSTPDKNSLFRPTRPNAQSKAQATDNAARAIMADEANRRAAKTLKLRQARLEMEAQRPEPAPSVTRGKKARKQPA
ncbi:hypothetical protein [Roseibium sp.]|uniref:hypothetical protein n=1 Tax=Roseibium sp. TaxID=1936156 RepID=UPI003D09B08E